MQLDPDSAVVEVWMDSILLIHGWVSAGASLLLGQLKSGLGLPAATLTPQSGIL